MKPNKFPSIHHRRRRRPSFAQLAATTTSHQPPTAHSRKERENRTTFFSHFPSIDRTMSFPSFSYLFSRFSAHNLLITSSVCYMLLYVDETVKELLPYQAMLDWLFLNSRTHIPPYSLLFREHTLLRWLLFLRREGERWQKPSPLNSTLSSPIHAMNVAKSNNWFNFLCFLFFLFH